MFQRPPEGKVAVEPTINLAGRDKVTQLEVVENGHVKHVFRIEDLVKRDSKLPELVFQESGWFLIRAVTDNDKTFRFADRRRTTSRSAIGRTSAAPARGSSSTGSTSAASA